MYQRKANGKFLLTGEYAVLDGALAVALPLRRGQWLEAQMTESREQPVLHWQALDRHNQVWFSAKFSLPGFDCLASNDHAVAGRLRQMFLHASAGHESLPPGEKPDWSRSWQVTTRLDFDRSWGLGTSSTLVALMADWLKVNPYLLLEATMGGSGYDIACAWAQGALTYRRSLLSLAEPEVKQIELSAEVLQGLSFIFLNQKMDSRAAIQAYRAKPSTTSFIERVSELSRAWVEAKNLPQAQQIMQAHESLLGERLGQIPIQKRLFAGFPGAVKSMGAWGGDFVLAATHQPISEVRRWCAGRGFHTVFSWQELAYSN